MFIPFFAREKKVDFFKWCSFIIFFISVTLFVASLAGFFDLRIIIPALIFFIIYFFYYFKFFDLEKKDYLFFLLVPLLLFGFILFKGFISGDAYVFWFPWAKIIAETGWMPVFFDTSPWIFISSDQPLFLIWLAAIMKLFPGRDNLTFIIPSVFNALTFLLIYHWLKKRGIPKIYLAFAILLLFCNPLLAKYGWDILQESLILFFFTLFFYFYDLFLKEPVAENQFFLFIAASLAILTKVSGFFLVIPLFYCFVRYKWYKQKSFYLLFAIFLPPLFWLARNYWLLGNPIFPIGEQIFHGPYASTVDLYTRYLPHNLSRDYITPWFIFEQILIAFPVFLVALFGLVKEKRWEIIAMLGVIFFLEANLAVAIPGSMRHVYAILGLLVFYGLVGLWKIKSRLFLTSIFFFANYLIFNIPLVKSQSQFLAPLENKLNIFYSIANLLNSNSLIIVILLSLFFYFFISKEAYQKILILIIFCLFLLYLSVIEISWLNIYGFVILYIIILLAVPFLAKRIKLFTAQSILISFILLILLVNSWGLALTYYLAHKEFIFPKQEAFEPAFSLAQVIKEKEKEKDNKNFYILNDVPASLGWFFSYKEFSIDNLTFHYITESRYQDTFTSEELRDFLKNYNFKYIMKMSDNAMMKNLYQKIENSPEFFLPIEKKENAFLWLVN
jgi:hypothetical protein